MKEDLKEADRMLQLVVMIIIGIVGFSFIFSWLLYFLFPLLGLIQLISAGIRTIDAYRRNSNNKAFFNCYWIMVVAWVVINGLAWNFNWFESTIFSQILLSIPIAIFYYAETGEIDKRDERESIEIEENRRLAAMMK